MTLTATVAENATIRQQPSHSGQVGASVDAHAHATAAAARELWAAMTGKESRIGSSRADRYRPADRYGARGWVYTGSMRSFIVNIWGDTGPEKLQSNISAYLKATGNAEMIGSRYNPSWWLRAEWNEASPEEWAPRAAELAGDPALVPAELAATFGPPLPGHAPPVAAPQSRAPDGDGLFPCRFCPQRHTLSATVVLHERDCHPKYQRLAALYMCHLTAPGGKPCEYASDHPKGFGAHLARSALGGGHSMHGKGAITRRNRETAIDSAYAHAREVRTAAGLPADAAQALKPIQALARGAARNPQPGIELRPALPAAEPVRVVTPATAMPASRPVAPPPAAPAPVATAPAAGSAVAASAPATAAAAAGVAGDMSPAAAARWLSAADLDPTLAAAAAEYAARYLADLGPHAAAALAREKELTADLAAAQEKNQKLNAAAAQLLDLVTT